MESLVTLLFIRPIKVDQLATHQDVRDTVIRMFVATDDRDWQTLVSSFSDPFILDMTSMVGGTPASMTPQQVAESWADGFKKLDHIHHQVGNFQIKVNGSDARITCYGIALHHRSTIASESRTRRFVGTYELDLTRQAGTWKITRLKFKLKFIDGNLHLEEEK